MNELKNKMVELYETYKYDWMNFLIGDDQLTFHHIKKIEDGGPTTIDNGALLTNRAHSYLHNIERIDKEIYLKINLILKEINKQKKAPTKLQRDRIQLLLIKYEVKNADKIIKKKEHIGKNRKHIAVLRRKKLQLNYQER